MVDDAVSVGVERLITVGCDLAQSAAYVAVADKHDVRLPRYGMEWSLESRNAIQADYRIQHTT